MHAHKISARALAPTHTGLSLGSLLRETLMHILNVTLIKAKQINTAVCASKLRSKGMKMEY